MTRRDTTRPGFSPADVDAEVERVGALDLPALRAEWRRLWRAEPPQLSRGLLRLAVAHRLQEMAHGGLPRATRRKLETAAKALQANGEPCPTPSVDLKPGSRLIREWDGRLHAVTAAEDGFIHDGVTYSSLSAIARKITGAHWSGPRFFGLRGAKPASSRAYPSHG